MFGGINKSSRNLYARKDLESIELPSIDDIEEALGEVESYNSDDFSFPNKEVADC